MQAVRSPSASTNSRPNWPQCSQNRWLVFVPSLWVHACAGVVYAYGNYSPLLKTVLGYNQQQISFLGIAKDVGASVGLPAGSLSEALPPWCLIAIGALHYMVGYGGLWLIVTGRLPPLPMWAVCVLILMGSNGDTYLSTAGVVTNVYNFPKSRGHAVGLLKGFNGICSALFTQIYMTFFDPADQGSFLLVVAVGPTVISVLAMFFVRRIDSKSELDGRPSDTLGFYFIYAISVIMAAYLMGVLVLQDAITVGFGANLAITVGLLILMSFPLVTPLLTWAAEMRGRRRSKSGTICPASAIRERSSDDVPDMEAPLLGGYGVNARLSRSADGSGGDEKAAQEPTLWQALMKVNLWLLLCAIICGAGTGMAAIDNMGQISQSQGYESSSIFVSMTSIFNFVGRILGGYISEVLARTYKLPRSWAMVLFQGMMVVGHILIAWGRPGMLYISTVLIGTGYGSHWGIALPILSELFGMRNFGILYNVSTIATPTGVLLFSGLLIGYLYDLEAAKQQPTFRVATMLATATSCSGAICFRLAFFISSGACVMSSFLTIILSIRTRSIYRTMYV